LESVCWGNSTVGSNPTLSAIFHVPSQIADKLMTCPKCNAPLIVKPVPGALKFPQRLECPVHGWLPERITPIRMRFHKDRPDW
jgi:hypothetical protein